MKHVSAKLLTLGLLSIGAALTSCGRSAPDEDNKIHLQLVPSNDPATLLTRAKALEPILKRYEPNYEWTIDVGSTYAATTTALAAGQIDGGFLTASGYAQMTIEKPGKTKLLLSASRSAYKVQADDFPGIKKENLEQQRKAMNGANGYVYRGEQSEKEVDFYCSIVITLKDSEREALNLPKLDGDGDGEVSLKEIHDGNAVWGVMGATSSSGYIYPTKYIYEGGYTGGFVDKAAYESKSKEEQAKFMIGNTEKSYPAMVDDLLSGQIDVAVGFFDIRYGSAFTQSGGKYFQDEAVFTKTYTQAVLDPIMNDTVCARGDLSDAKSEAIRNALKKAVKDGGKDEEGTGAWLLYQIYSHTGYINGDDANYDAAREMYRWTMEHSTK